MTNRKIEGYKKKLVKIGDLSGAERSSGLRDLAKKLGVFILSDNDVDTHTLYQNIHTYLQTEMMLNACISAKRSCIWAAIAAIAACISIVVMLCLQ